MRVSIDSLFGDDHRSPNPDAEFDPKAIVRDAHVVVAVDVMTGNKQLVFGKSVLQRIAGGKSGQNLAVLEVELDMEADDLEKLAALVTVVKGSHDLL